MRFIIILLIFLFFFKNQIKIIKFGDFVKKVTYIVKQVAYYLKNRNAQTRSVQLAVRLPLSECKPTEAAQRTDQHRMRRRRRVFN